MNIKLEPQWFDRSNLRGIGCIVHGWTLWIGCGLLAMEAWFAGWPWPLGAAVAAICLVLSGMGMFYVTTLAHEGLHGGLNRNRHVSMALGVVASSAVPMFASVGYTVRHWHHHLYTNTLEDPDFADYRAYRSFASRVALGTLNSSIGFWRNLVRLFFAPDRLDLRHYPYPLRVARRFALLNVAAVMAFLASGVAAVLAHPPVGVFVFLMPGAVANLYLGIVPYVDHAGTGLEKGANARTCPSGVLSVLLLGTNCHREHHLHPSVVSYKLPALHRHYVESGAVMDARSVTPDLLTALRIGATARLDP
jgi:fatty acid desaturase